MTQPINRETAIALAKEVGFKASVGQTVDDTYHPDRNAIGKSVPVEWVQRFYDLAVAHSRKDAEPVAKIISSGPADFPLLQWLSADHSFREPIGSLLYPHPPEADKLLQQALEALEYRLQQTRPIHQADVVMESIRTYLENKA